MAMAAMFTAPISATATRARSSSFSRSYRPDAAAVSR
jgi:hypothetical protein